MIEETLDEAGRIESHKLVDCAVRQALLGETGRGDGAGGAEDIELPLAEPLDQRNHRQKFADARAVHPYQRPGRARDLAPAITFVDAGDVFFAMPEPMGEQRGGE